MNPGIYMPKVPGIPKLDLRVEAAYTDLPYGVLFPGFYYFNVRYLDGRRNNGNIIGHWVGRQGNAVQAWSTYWFSPQSTIQFGYRHHKVSADFIQGGGTVNDFSVRTNFPIRARTSLSALLQYEKWKFPVLSANARTNFTSSIQITYHPHLGRN